MEAGMVSRRMLLVVGGVGVTLIGATGLRLHSNLGPARAPWKQAGAGFGDPRLDALSYAVLAPSPHNIQPWLVRLDDDGGNVLSGAAFFFALSMQGKQSCTLGLYLVFAAFGLGRLPAGKYGG